jgi:hypothetical protein
VGQRRRFSWLRMRSCGESMCTHPVFVRDKEFLELDSDCQVFKEKFAASSSVQKCANL